MDKIILASASPRRKELLESLGIKFEVIVSEADEKKINKDAMPQNLYVQELALLKAAAVLKKIGKTNALIISADTIVCCDNKILGKPKSREDAKEMLKFLSGKCHFVYSGICVMDAKTSFSVLKSQETKVYFKELSDEVIDSYIKTNEPFDKAGAYGIQGFGAVLIDKIEGDYFNVVGLPISKLYEVLKDEFDFDILRREENEV